MKKKMKKRNDNVPIKATHIHKDSTDRSIMIMLFDNLFMGEEKIKKSKQKKIPKKSVDSMSSDGAFLVETINSQHVFPIGLFSTALALVFANVFVIAETSTLRKTMRILHGELATVFAFQMIFLFFSVSRLGNFKILFFALQEEGQQI